MSRYDRNDYDEMIYELEEFLKTHSIYELLKLVTTAINSKEEGYLD